MLAPLRSHVYSEMWDLENVVSAYVFGVHTMLFVSWRHVVFRSKRCDQRQARGPRSSPLFVRPLCCDPHAIRGHHRSLAGGLLPPPALLSGFADTVDGSGRSSGICSPQKHKIADMRQAWPCVAKRRVMRLIGVLWAIESLSACATEVGASDAAESCGQHPDRSFRGGRKSRPSTILNRTASTAWRPP